MDTCVTQAWTHAIPMMQQTVLLTAIRGPDGLSKYNAAKLLLRWYRRCVLLSAMDGQVLVDPCSNNGGSFTGPSLSMEFRDSWEAGMDKIVDDYLRQLDGTPHHFHMHLMHASEILGYKHPTDRIAHWWMRRVYLRFVNDMHLSPETHSQLDERLGDSREGWLKRADPATTS